MGDCRIAFSGFSEDAVIVCKCKHPGRTIADYVHHNAKPFARSDYETGMQDQQDDLSQLQEWPGRLLLRLHQLRCKTMESREKEISCNVLCVLEDRGQNTTGSGPTEIALARKNKTRRPGRQQTLIQRTCCTVYNQGRLGVWTQHSSFYQLAHEKFVEKLTKKKKKKKEKKRKEKKSCSAAAGVQQSRKKPLRRRTVFEDGVLLQSICFSFDFPSYKTSFPLK